MVSTSRRRFAQGLRDFADFQDYYDNWICRNIIPDLNTIFEGTLAQWTSDGRPDHGRGDFFLASMLFAIFDHLGGFLAGHAQTSQETNLNISRVARCLPTTTDVDLVIANFARHALVHGAWPQTGYRMRDGQWGFGLGICCDPCPEEHDLLYTRQYTLRPDDTPNEAVTVLKFVLNVNVLRLELTDWLLNRLDPRSVKHEVWEAIQKRAMQHGDTTRHDPRGWRDRNGPSQWKQINDLRLHAMNLGVWKTPGVAVGRRPPHARSHRERAC